MHRDANVAGLRKCRATRVDPDANADLRLIGPCMLPERPLDPQSRVESAPRLTEHREEFVRARVDLPTAGFAHAPADQRPHVTQHRRIPITEPLCQTRRT